MSIVQMTKLFYRTGLGLGELAVALALADFADDRGENCYPSNATLARKLGTSRGNVQRIMRRLREIGYVEVTGNATGGAPGATRRVRLHPEVFDAASAAPTGIGSDTGIRSDAGIECDAEGYQIRCQPISDPTPNPSLTVIEPSVERAPHGAPAHAGVHGTSRGTAMNEQALPELWKQWSLTEGGMTAREAAREFDRFHDYWIAVPGAKGSKLDWFATWRNWCRRATDEGTRKRTDGPTPSAASMLGPMKR